MSWETRTHWFDGLLWPSRGYVVLALLGVASFFTRNAWCILAGILALVSAGIGFSIIRTLWRNFTLSVSLGERAIRERHGFNIISERYINLGMIGSVSIVQRPLGRLFDFGDMTINALGGPYEWKNVGHFHTVRRIVESRGEWLPDPPVAVRLNVREQFLHLGWILRRWGQSIHRRLQSDRRWWRNRTRRVRILSIPRPQTLAYVRFLRFAENLLFGRNFRRFDAESGIFRSGRKDVSPAEEQIFWHILRIRHIMVNDRWGRLIRHSRIRSMRDLSERIPTEWFNKYYQQYQAFI